MAMKTNRGENNGTRTQGTCKVKDIVKLFWKLGASLVPVLLSRFGVSDWQPDHSGEVKNTSA